MTDYFLLIAEAKTDDAVGWGGFGVIVLILYIAHCLSPPNNRDDDDDDD